MNKQKSFHLRLRNHFFHDNDSFITLNNNYSKSLFFLCIIIFSIFTGFITSHLVYAQEVFTSILDTKTYSIIPLTFSEGTDEKHIRLAGSLSTISVKACQGICFGKDPGPQAGFDLTYDPDCVNNNSFKFEHESVFGGDPPHDIAGLYTCNEGPDKIVRLLIIRSDLAPAGGEKWEVALTNEGNTKIKVSWCSGNTALDTYVPDIDVNPTLLDFEDLMVGDTRTLSVTISNLFVAPSTLSGILLNGDRQFSIVGSIPTEVPPMEVPPMKDVTIDVEFNPLEEMPYEDTLSLTTTTNDPDNPEKTVDILLRGRGIDRKLVLCLDASGSMRARPNETAPVPVGAGPFSRMAEVKDSLEPFFDVLDATVESIIKSGGGALGLELGVVIFQGDDASVLSSLSDVNSTSLAAIINKIGVPYSPGTGILPGGETPMNAGLVASLGLFGPPPKQKRPEGIIFLMSDGFATVGPRPTDPGGAVYNIEEREIGVFSLAFGDDITGVYEVDHVLLSEISERTSGEYLVYAPGEVFKNELTKSFQKALISIGMQTIIDPFNSITSGQTKEHIIPVSASDRRVGFLISWGENYDGLLSLDLVASDGTEIKKIDAQLDPIIQYREGAKSVFYMVDNQYFQKPGKLGLWKMRIFFDPNKSEEADLETVEYSYSTTVASDLKMKVNFDKKSYLTGDRVLIEASLTDRGKPILGADVKLNPGKRDISFGNWYADNPVTEEDYANIPSELYEMENFTKIFLKGYVLTKLKGIPAPQIVIDETGIPLLDDGTNGDRIKNDGVYTYESDPLDKTGIHTYHIIATGNDLRGGDFRREKRVDQYVLLRPDLKASEFFFERVNPFLYRIKVLLKDKFGNIMSPGLESKIDLIKTTGTWATPIVDTLEGVYYREINVKRTEKSALSLKVENAPEIKFLKLELDSHLKYLPTPYSPPVDFFLDYYYRDPQYFYSNSINSYMNGYAPSFPVRSFSVPAQFTQARTSGYFTVTSPYSAPFPHANLSWTIIPYGRFDYPLYYFYWPNIFLNQNYNYSIPWNYYLNSWISINR